MIEQLQLQPSFFFSKFTSTSTSEKRVPHSHKKKKTSSGVPQSRNPIFCRVFLFRSLHRLDVIYSSLTFVYSVKKIETSLNFVSISFYRYAAYFPGRFFSICFVRFAIERPTLRCSIYNEGVCLHDAAPSWQLTIKSNRIGIRLATRRMMIIIVT